MKTLKDVKKYIQEIRHIFLVDQYDIYVMDAPANTDTVADIEVRYDYLDATIKIYPAFYKTTEEYQKKTLIHELCHFITLLQDHIVDDLLDGKVVTEKHAIEVMERANSWIERILCTNLKKELGL